MVEMEGTENRPLSEGGKIDSLTFGRAISNLKDAEHSVRGKASEYLSGIRQNLEGFLGYINDRPLLKIATIGTAGEVLFSQIASGCAPRTASAQDMITATTTITESYTPTPAAEFTPTLKVTIEPTAAGTPEPPEPATTPTLIGVEISVDGNYIPVPDAFVDTGLGKIKEIKDLEEPNDTINKVVEKIKEKLSIQNDEDLQKAYLDIVCENGNRAYMIVKDNNTGTFYAVFVKDKDGFYLSPDSEGELALLPIKIVPEESRELIGFDIKGDLLIPPTFTFSIDTGELTYTDPKTGEQVVMTKESNTSPKMLAMLKGETIVEKPLTPEQQKLVEEVRNGYLLSYKTSPDIYTITFDQDDNLLTTDNTSGRVIGKGGKWIFFDKDNITGKDQLEDGTWVFNNNLKECLANEGLDKTHLKGNNGKRNDPSSAVDNYMREIWDKANADNPGELEKLVGGFSSGENFSWKSVPLHIYPDGTSSWGIVVGKKLKNKSWIESKRVLVYKDSDGAIKFIPVYYPNYLIYR